MAQPNRTVMLSVGIGNYLSPRVPDLALPPADATAMAQALLSLGSGETLLRVLLNEEATKARIQAGLAWLADSVGPDDLAVFYYSGHGARYEDQDSDELDAYDEFLCPHDTGVGGGVSTFIRDDEMREWLAAVTAKTKQVAVLFDSCHSGDAVRLGEATPRELPRDVVQSMLSGYKRPPKAAGLTPGEAPLEGHMLLAAAEEQQSSFEIRGMKNGLFTTYLLEGLADPSLTTFEGLFKYAQNKVGVDAAKYQILQTPHLIPRVEGDLAYR